MDSLILAETLANRPYTEIIRQDLSTDGDPVFLAFTPELEGCMGQGLSGEEAKENLREARVAFILSLLEDNLIVPGPQSYPTSTTSGFSTTYVSESHSSPNRWIRAENDSEEYATTQLIKA